MCRHSTSMMKFSYWRSVRITPIGCPVQISSPSLTDQVFGDVLTSIQPLKSFPLKRSRNASSCACEQVQTVANASNRRICSCAGSWDRKGRGIRVEGKANSIVDRNSCGGVIVFKPSFQKCFIPVFLINSVMSCCLDFKSLPCLTRNEALRNRVINDLFFCRVPANRTSKSRRNSSQMTR